MVLPSSYDVVDTQQYLLYQQQQNRLVYCSNAVVYGDEIVTVRRRLTSTALVSNHYKYFDQMPDELIRPDYDPNQPSSSSIDPNANDDDSWLRLRLGSDVRQSSSSTLDTRRGDGGRVLVELDLLPAITNTSHQQLQQQVIRSNTRPPGFFHTPEFRTPPRPVALLQRIPVPELNWALIRPSNIIGGNYYMSNPNPNPTAAAASMSNLMMPMGPNFFARPSFGGATQMGNNGAGGMSSSSGMQIIRPLRPNVGMWFMLQALRNQVRQPFLPQIPKSYLRIKNGQMNIRLLMKYLVQKLGLESESEVEIRCRGQILEPISTLQHVRDHIWCIRRDSPLNFHTTDSPSSSTLSAVPTDGYIMILHYARPILSTAAAGAATTTTGTTSSAPIL